MNALNYGSDAIRSFDLIQVEVNCTEISCMAKLRFHQFASHWNLIIWYRIQGINESLGIDLAVNGLIGPYGQFLLLGQYFLNEAKAMMKK